MPNWRRGAAAIEDAASRRGGSGFRPFVPRIEWREDGESKHVLVLTPIEEVFTVAIHEFIPVGKGERSDGEEYTKYESFISRKDEAIGEDYDDLEDRLERTPKLRCMGVMAELEPVMENRNGRKKVKSFVVKTDTYTRKTDDGEEEVTQPVIGIATQSAITLWGTLGSADQSQGPLTELPIEIIRRGKDQNTRYDTLPFMDIPVDLSPIIEYVDGLSYLRDDITDVINAAEAADGDLGAAQAIADALLMKRVEELADAERYEELVAPLEIEDMPKPFGGSKKKAPSKKKRPERPKRSTRRQATKDDADEQPKEKSAPKVESKEDHFAALKARVEGGK